jgi:hypothetical protein
MMRDGTMRSGACSACAGGACKVRIKLAVETPKDDRPVEADPRIEEGKDEEEKEEG